MSKKKELLAIGAAVASCAAAAAGYSYFKNENKPDQPQNQNIVGDDGNSDNATGLYRLPISIMLDPRHGTATISQINQRENASMNKKETDDLTGDDW